MLLQKFLKSAIDAHRGTSFSPEKRGENLIKDYSAELEEDMKTILETAAKYGTDGTPAANRYRQRYERHFTAWLGSRGRILSTMIAGPANFPAARMQKYNDWERSKYEYFREWRKRCLNAITRSYKPKETPLTELEKARKDLEKRKTAHEQMKQANAIWRRTKGKECRAELLAVGLSAKVVDEMLQADEEGNPSFRGFYLANNLANIKRLEDRVKMLEKKAQKHAAGVQQEKDINGIKIVENFKADRLQIIFPNRPDAATIEKLKGNGFRWSPANTAWQRKLTPNAQWAAKHIISQIV